MNKLSIMEKYKIGLIPGPVSIPENVRRVWLNDFASSDLEEEFFALYHENQILIQKLLRTKNDVVITSGEAMSILWASLKCTLKPGEKILAVSSGLFGSGFADMARAFGAIAETCEFPYDEVPEPEKVYEHAKKFRPKVITAVHCETPSGTLTPCLAEIGKIAREFEALFVVDFVSSAGGCELDVDACKIDIGLLGSQKVLSLTPSLSISTISPRAWQIINDVNYSGYEAFADWREVPEKKFMPYTHDWHSMKALNISLENIMNEGIARHSEAVKLCQDWECENELDFFPHKGAIARHSEAVKLCQDLEHENELDCFPHEAIIAKHSEAAKLCRDLGREIGLELFPKSEDYCSPTVTAFYVPKKFTWQEFNERLRARGLAVGGNYGSLAGKVFRIGHMGSQADNDLVKRGMKIIREVLA